MAFPTVVGVGTVASGVGAIVPGLPSGAAADDIHVLLVETEDQALPAMVGWTEADGSPVSMAVGTVTQLTVRWRRMVAGDTAPTVPDSGNHQLARILGVRGCPRSADPWAGTQASTDTGAGTAVSIAGAASIAQEILVIAALTTGTDVASTTHVTGWANSDLTSLTERVDNWVTTGLGGGIGAATGLRQSAGAYAATTATLTTGNGKAMWTGALRPDHTAVHML